MYDGTIVRKRGSFNDVVLRLLSNGKLSIIVYDPAQPGSPAVLDGSIVPLNVWSKVAVSYDGFTFRLYVDDAEVASLPKVLNLQWTGGTYMGSEIGNSTWDGTNWAFAGDIDEVVIEPAP